MLEVKSINQIFFYLLFISSSISDLSKSISGALGRSRTMSSSARMFCFGFFSMTLSTSPISLSPEKVTLDCTSVDLTSFSKKFGTSGKLNKSSIIGSSKAGSGKKFKLLDGSGGG